MHASACMSQDSFRTSVLIQTECFVKINFISSSAAYPDFVCLRDIVVCFKIGSNKSYNLTKKKCLKYSITYVPHMEYIPQNILSSDINS